MKVTRKIAARKMVNGPQQEPVYSVVPGMQKQLLMPELVGAIFESVD
jgi:hypothetical protein